jgi:hypothetical protein
MRAVGSGGVDVLTRAGAFGGQRPGLGRTRAAGQGLFRRRGPHRGGCHVHQGYRAALHGHTDDGPVDGAFGELLERPAGLASRGHRQPDLGEQFVRCQPRLEQALEEVGGRDLPGAGRAAGHQHPAQRQHHRGQVGRGVAVDQRPTDRAPVPHLGIAHLASRVGQQRHRRDEQLGMLDVVMAGQRADRDVPVLGPDVAQLMQRAEVDEHLWLGQPQLHQWQQRVPARQELGLVAVLGGQRQRLVSRGRALVGERWRDHAAPSGSASRAADPEAAGTNAAGREAAGSAAPGSAAS